MLEGYREHVLRLDTFWRSDCMYHCAREVNKNSRNYFSSVIHVDHKLAKLHQLYTETL